MFGEFQLRMICVWDTFNVMFEKAGWIYRRTCSSMYTNQIQGLLSGP